LGVRASGAAAFELDARRPPLRGRLELSRLPALAATRERGSRRVAHRAVGELDSIAGLRVEEPEREADLPSGRSIKAAEEAAPVLLRLAPVPARGDEGRLRRVGVLRPADEHLVLAV